MGAPNAIAPSAFTTAPVYLHAKTNILRIQYNEKDNKITKNVKQVLTDEHSAIKLLYH